MKKEESTQSKSVLLLGDFLVLVGIFGIAFAAFMCHTAFGAFVTGCICLYIGMALGKGK